MVRQANIFISTMKDYSKVVEATRVSMEANGTTAQKYEHIMDSVEAKINQFIVTWEKMLNNMNQGDTVKGVVDFGTDIVEAFDIIINKWKIVENTITPILIVATLGKVIKSIQNLTKFLNVLNMTTKSNGVEKLRQSYGNLGNALSGLTLKQKIAILSTNQLTDAERRAALQASGLSREQIKLAMEAIALKAAQNAATGATNLLTRAWNGLKVAIASNPIGAAITIISIAIGAVTTAIGMYNQRIDEMIEKSQELRTNMGELNSSYEDTKTRLQELSKEFDELTAGMDKNQENLGMSEEHYNRYKQILEEVSQMSPELVQGYELQGKALEGNNQVLKDAIELYDEKYKKQLREELRPENVKTVSEGLIEDIKKSENKIKAESEELAKQIIVAIRKPFFEEGKVMGDDIKRQLQKVLRFSDQEMEDMFNNNVKTQDIIANMIGDEAEFKQAIDGFYKNFEYLADNIDLASVLAEDNSSLATFKNQIFQYGAALTDVTDKQKEFQKYLIATMEVHEASGKLTDDMKNFITSYAETLKVTGDTTQEEINSQIDFINSLVVKMTSDPMYQGLLNKLFSLDADQISSDFTMQAETIINSLKSLMGSSFTSEFEMNLRGMLKINYSLPDGTTFDNYDSAVSYIAATNTYITRERLESLSQEDFNVLLNITAELEGNETWDQIISQIENYKSQIEGSVDSVNSLTGNLSGLTPVLSQLGQNFMNISDKMNMLNQAADEHAQYGVILEKTWNDLAKNDLLQYLDFTSGSLQILTQDLLNNAEATKAEMIEQLNNALAKDLATLATEGLTDAEQEAKIAAENGGEAAKTFASILNNELTNGAITATVAVDAYNRTADAASKGSFEGKEKQLQEIVDTYNRLRASIDSVRHSSGSVTNAFNGVATSADNAKKSIDALKQSLSSAKSTISGFMSTVGQMLKQGYLNQADRLQSKLDKITANYEREKEALQDEKEARNKQFDAEKKALQDLKKAEEDRFKERKKQLDDEKKALDKKYKEQKEALDNELKAYQDRINAQLDLLRLKEEERKYDKEVEKQRNEISKIEDQLAALEFDNSIEAQKKKLELQEQLAEKQEQLSETQHDRDISLQEKALQDELDRFEKAHQAKVDAMEKEQELAKENLDNRLEALEVEKDATLDKIQAEIDGIQDAKDAYNEAHQARLDAIEEQYQRDKARKEKEINDIRELANNEYKIRKEAIDKIEKRNGELFKRLILWNREYGTGIDQDIIAAWNDAYFELEKYEYRTIGVQGVLEKITGEMWNIERTTKDVARAFDDAAISAAKMADAISKKKTFSDYSDSYLLSQGGLYEKPKSNSNNSSNSYLNSQRNSKNVKKSHDGEDNVKRIPTALDKILGIKPSETLRVLEVGERIVSKEENNLNTDNFLESNISKNTSTMQEKSSYRNITTNENSPVFTIGDIVIEGNATQETVIALRKERDSLIKEVFKKMDNQTKSGAFRNMKNFFI